MADYTEEQKKASWMQVAGICADLWWTESKLATVPMNDLTEHNRALIAAFRRGVDWALENRSEVGPLAERKEG